MKVLAMLWKTVTRLQFYAEHVAHARQVAILVSDYKIRAAVLLTHMPARSEQHDLITRDKILTCTTRYESMRLHGSSTSKATAGKC